MLFKRDKHNDDEQEKYIDLEFPPGSGMFTSVIDCIISISHDLTVEKNELAAKLMQVETSDSGKIMEITKRMNEISETVREFNSSSTKPASNINDVNNTTTLSDGPNMRLSEKSLNLILTRLEENAKENAEDVLKYLKLFNVSDIKEAHELIDKFNASAEESKTSLSLLQFLNEHKEV